ncbi:MAG: SDR family NAD(P)-dependent oxidoreductase [Granulosicoccaceae bacterium]
MKKTILLTGATDGIGLVTAKMLAEQGHHLLLHGRSTDKLEQAIETVTAVAQGGIVEGYLADMSRIADVEALAANIAEKHSRLDVLINNAGVYKTPVTTTPEGLDVRFVVNTLAPFHLTQKLLPLLDGEARVVNLSSAAQAPVSIDALKGLAKIDDMGAYAQSKLAITMWSRVMAESLGTNGPKIIAVNPGSLLASKMVKEGFGVVGSDLSIGADILIRAALSDEFANASGKYYDNDNKAFAPPHPDGLDNAKSERVVQTIEAVLKILIG